MRFRRLTRADKKTNMKARSFNPMAGRSVVEMLEARQLLSVAPGTIAINGSGVVTVTGTTVSDTIAAGTYPLDSSKFYFTVQTSGVGTETEIYAKSSVHGVQIFADPFGSTPTGTNNDFVNTAGTNFGFAIAIVGGTGNDTIEGQLGANQITTGQGQNLVFGSNGNDTIEGLGSSETLRSGGGNDTIQATAGNNILVGGRDGSQLIGGSGHDTMRSGRGNATLHAGSGGSLLIGGFGNDYLEGSSGNDTIIGGSGQATLVGSTGADYLDAGWDGFLIFDGASPLAANTNTQLAYAGGGNDTIVANTSSSILTGGGGANVWGVNSQTASLEDVKNGEFVAENDTVGTVNNSTAITLTIQQNNQGVIKSLTIPSGAGNSPYGTSAVRAIDANGTIVFQSTNAQAFTLGDFFNHWGVDFNSVGVGQFIAASGSGHTMAMTVNGVNNTQFQNYVVQNGDNIVVTFTQ